VSGIGVVVALPREIPAGFVRFDIRQRVETPSFSIYRSAPVATQHVAVQAGVGRTRAAEGARLLVRRFSPQGLVSFGFAGGLAPELARGTLIIGTEVVCGERSTKCVAANRDLVEQFRAAAIAEELPVQQGRLVSSRDIEGQKRGMCSRYGNRWDRRGGCRSRPSMGSHAGHYR
jgi:nucleoside phosphorylase